MPDAQQPQTATLVFWRQSVETIHRPGKSLCPFALSCLSSCPVKRFGIDAATETGGGLVALARRAVALVERHALTGPVIRAGRQSKTEKGPATCRCKLPPSPLPAAACQPLPAAFQLPPSAARRNPHSQIGRPESRELRPSFLQATNLQRFPRVRRHAYGGALASGNSAAIPAASDAASERNAPTSPSCMRLGAGINLAQRNRGPTAPDPSC